MDAFNIELYRLPAYFLLSVFALDDESWEIINDEINREIRDEIALEEENPDFGDDL